jgi:hemoglobin/transferrin/lactoferrin receptor protein
MTMMVLAPMRRGLLRGVAVGALVLGTGAPALAQGRAPANAQEPQRTRFDIPAQSLSGALTAFGLQSGYQVSVDEKLLSGRRTAAVRGELAASDAIARLLAGTGLGWRLVDSRSIVIEALPQTADNAVQLGTLRVEAGQRGQWSDEAGQGGSEQASADAPYHTPGSSAHISREQINRVPPNTTGDIFRDTPGVASGSNYNGTAIDVNIRGAQGMDRVKVLVDGTEQTNSVYRGYDGPDNRSYIDAELIGGVDIEKGPGAGSRSAGAIGGVVSIRTLNVNDLVKPGDSFGGRVRGLIGDNRIGAYDNLAASGGRSFISANNWLGSVAAGYRGDRLDLVAAYSHRQTGNYFAGNQHGDLSYKRLLLYSVDYAVLENYRYSPVDPGNEVWNTSENTESGLLKTKYRFSDELNVEAGAVYFLSRYGMTYPLWMIPVWYTEFPQSDVESQRYYSTLRWGPSSDLINLYANVWYTKVHSQDGTHPYFPDEGTSTHNQAWGLNLSNDAIFSTPIGEATLKVGGEYSSTKSDRWISYSLPVDDYYLAMKGHRNVGGLFAKLNVSPSPWLTLTGGLRYDWYNNRGTTGSLNFIIDEQTGARYFDISYDTRRLSASSISPSGAITITPVDGIQLFAQYGRGWRPPSLVETTGPGIVINFVANPNLRPERSDNLEIGANLLRKDVFGQGDTVRAKVLYFDNSYNDYIVRLNGPSFGNLERAHFAGFEGSIQYDSPRIFASAQATYYTQVKYCFEIPEYWQQPEYGYGVAKGCFTESPLSSWPGSNNPAEYSGSATLGTRMLDGRLTFGGRWIFYGEPLTRISPANTGSLEKRWTATQTYDLFAGYKINDAARIDFSIDNLTDRYFLAPHTVAQIPGPGRQTKLSVTFNF